MDKIKAVISGGRKDTDATHEAETSQQTASTGTTAPEEYHPIYDQFKAHDDQSGTTGESTRTSEYAGALGTPGTGKESTLTSGHQHGTASRPTDHLTEDASTASIRSGVLGFPKAGDDNHASLENSAIKSSLDSSQRLTGPGESVIPDRTIGSEQNETSHLGRDASLGAGALGAGGAATQGLHHQKGDVSSATIGQSTTHPLESETERRTEHTSTGATGHAHKHPHESHSHTERQTEPIPQQQSARIGEQNESSHFGRDAALGAGAVGAGGIAAHELSNRDEETTRNPISQTTGTQGITENQGTTETDRSFPLAGGVTGGHSTGHSSTIPSSQHEREPDHRISSPIDLTHQHAGHGHKYEGDPCEAGVPPAHAGTAFSKGPHSTDTANRVDPNIPIPEELHRHIPGEFPDPTPAEETSEPSFGRETGIGGAGATTSAAGQKEPASGHHFGRDAAAAGGIGAAGLGAAAAEEHHQKQSTDIGAGELHTGVNPYSSKTVDPRVYGTSGPPTNTNAQSVSTSQIPIASKSGSEREAGVLAGHEGSRQHGGLEENVQPSTTQQETTKPNSQIPQPTSQTEESKHHYGRDAALVGAGAAGAGGLYASQRGDKPDTGPASETIGPHKSNAANIIDPRVQPDPSLQKHEVGPTSTQDDPASQTIGPHKTNLANILDPRVKPDPEKQRSHATAQPSTSDNLERDTSSGDKHHYGRDAAIVGGAGAAGYGAHEAGQAYDEHRSTQPSTAMNEQRYDPTATGTYDPTQSSQHHGRDATLAGGAGAAGTGAYAASQDAPKSDFAKQLSHDSPTTGTEQIEQPSQHHLSRDAAVVGGLGAAGAAGAGAYASIRDPKDATPQTFIPQQQGQDATTATGTHHPSQTIQQQQQPTSTQHQRYDSSQQPDQQHQKRDAAALSAAGVAAGGAAGYGLSQHDADKAEKERLQAREKELEHQRSKDAKALDKKHEKEVHKEEKKHEKEIQKEHKEEEKGEKKHHLFGFLHRDKKHKDPLIDDKTESGAPRDATDYSAGAAGVGAAGIGAGAYEHEVRHSEDHERNRLHKDPPEGHPAREALIGGNREHVGTDGPIGRSDQVYGDQTTSAGVHGTHEPESQQGIIIEPHTGLPMNVGKYGDGHGGTDGSSTMRGAHQVPTGEATNWEAIKKANTPY